MVAPDDWATLGAPRIIYAGGAMPPSNVLISLSGPREPRKVTKPNNQNGVLVLASKSKKWPLLKN